MKRLNKTLAIAALAAAAFASAAFAAGEPDPVLKVDYLNSDLPADYFHANFRTSLDPFPQSKLDALGRLGYSTKVSREGMDQIQAAGGADFTAKQFDWILKKMKEIGSAAPGNITVLDLRGETHGLIDGNVFMSWIPNNYVNEGKPTEEVVASEKKLVDSLRGKGTVEMYSTDDKWGADIAKPKLSFKSPKLQTEEELVKSTGASYYRLATTNHFRPDDHEVDLYVDFMKKLPEDRWLFIHCYSGEGRTTNFMVMTDIFKNYKKASFDDIAARQGLIGPVDVRAELAVTGKTHYKMKASVEKRIFLEQFYLYAKDTDFSKPWSQWARARGICLKYYPDF